LGTKGPVTRDSHLYEIFIRRNKPNRCVFLHEILTYTRFSEVVYFYLMNYEIKKIFSIGKTPRSPRRAAFDSRQPTATGAAGRMQYALQDAMHNALQQGNARGETPLRRAIRENKADAVRILLLLESELLFEETVLKETILQLAVKMYKTHDAHGSIVGFEIIEIIFDHLNRSDLTRRRLFLEKVDDWENNIMHTVCWLGSVELLRKLKNLVESATDSNYFINLLRLKNKRGWSCLIQAMQSGNEALFDYLLIIDFELVNVCDEFGNNFIHYAIKGEKYMYLYKCNRSDKRRKI
jgi:ankyrin repeat protein